MYATMWAITWKTPRPSVAGCKRRDWTFTGGVNAPYIWLKTPDGMDSWRFFEALLNRFGIVGTPGVGFGPSGEGYFRLTAFGSHENTRKAMRRIADAGHWSEWKI